MKRTKTIKFKIISVSLFILMAVSVPFNGMVQTVSAATNETSAAPTATSPKSTDLQTNNSEEAQKQKDGLQALGLSTEQPSRTDAAGKVIDKNTNNPLGNNSLGLNRTMQLATAGIGNNAEELYDIYNKPIGSGGVDFSKPLLGKDTLLGNQANDTSNWRRAQKAMTSADINGSGKDSIVTAAIPTIDGSNVKLELIVTDYNDGGKPIEKELVLLNSIPKPASYTDWLQVPIHVTAGDYDHNGKDEIAVVVDRTLYICKITESGSDLSANIISQTTFDEQSVISKIPNNDTPRIDVKSGDADGDGFKELLVTTGSSNGGAIYTPKLLIYQGADATKPVANIELKSSNSSIYRAASIAVGDVFGEGQNVIAIAGDMRNAAWQFTTIYYHPGTQTYDTTLSNKFYTLSVPKVIGELKTLNCVSLETPVPGKGQFLVFGDVIFRYDSNANNGKGDFVRRNVVNTIYGGGNITNVNYGSGDNTFILDTIVGNFDGNTEGKEQIIMLHYNNWWSGPGWEYITWCNEDSNGNIVANIGKLIWHGGQYNYPAICAPDVYDNGIRLVYDHSEFTFSDPTVIAVLGATPYYKELTDKYEALGNVGTTFGTEDTTENSESKGVTAKVGVSFGYSSETSVFGQKVSEIEFEAKVENSFSHAWSSSKSTSKSISFTNYYSDDSVVVTTVPYDIYYYKMYDKDHPEGVEININVPYAPETSIMSLTRYNSIAKGIKNAPVVGPEVLKHTVGDPRSYPRSEAGLSNVPKKDVLVGSDDKGNSFIGAGSGNVSSELSITETQSKGHAFDYTLSLEVSFSATVFGAKLGTSVETEYSSNVTTTTSKSTTRTGGVAALPDGYENYDFQWGLVAYNYNLTKGNSTQECQVISYMVKPIRPFPPAVPENFKVKDGSTGLTSTTLQWDKVSGASGYKISRADAENGNYKEIRDLKGADTTIYTDSNLTDNKIYYYKVLAYSTIEGISTDSLSVQALSVESLKIKTQPKLSYTKGDALNLSAAKVLLNLSNGNVQEVDFPNFSKNNLTVSIPDGTKLDTSNTGSYITITYTPANKSVKTNNLIVNVVGSKNFMVNTSFKVGGNTNASELLPNQMLEANVSVENNRVSSQEIILIVALYDDKGSLVNMSIISKDIAAKATENINGGFMLPSNVTNYTAKAFVWNGTDITVSSQTPLSDAVQIPE